MLKYLDSNTRCIVNASRVAVLVTVLRVNSWFDVTVESSSCNEGVFGWYVQINQTFVGAELCPGALTLFNFTPRVPLSLGVRQNAT